MKYLDALPILNALHLLAMFIKLIYFIYILPLKSSSPKFSFHTDFISEIKKSQNEVEITLFEYSCLTGKWPRYKRMWPRMWFTKSYGKSPAGKMWQSRWWPSDIWQKVYLSHKNTVSFSEKLFGTIMVCFASKWKFQGQNASYERCLRVSWMEQWNRDD